MSNALIVMPIAAGACVATMLGGFFALALQGRLYLVLGFSAGAVIGVAFFDLMPEALETGTAWGARNILLLCALGFFVYAVMDRAILPHGPAHYSLARGWLGAGSLSAHSVLDGFAIGIAFQASRAVGLIVAVAVLMHDFSDGLNTVNVVVRNGGNRRMALRWLIMDAVAPMIGAAISLMVRIPESGLALILALFSGFFLYIGASDLLPESHRASPRFATTAATLLGAATLLVATRLAG